MTNARWERVDAVLQAALELAGGVTVEVEDGVGHSAPPESGRPRAGKPVASRAARWPCIGQAHNAPPRQPPDSGGGRRGGDTQF